MVVAGNSSRYCHNQTTDPNPGPNPNRIPNCQLSLLEMAENGSSSEWRPLGMTGRHPNQPMTPQPQALYASACWVMWLDGYSNNITSIVGKYMTLTFDLLTSKPNEFISDKSLEKIHQRMLEISQKQHPRRTDAQTHRRTNDIKTISPAPPNGGGGGKNNRYELIYL